MWVKDSLKKWLFYHMNGISFQLSIFEDTSLWQNTYSIYISKLFIKIYKLVFLNKIYVLTNLVKACPVKVKRKTSLETLLTLSPTHIRFSSTSSHIKRVFPLC